MHNKAEETRSKAELARSLVCFWSDGYYSLRNLLISCVGQLIILSASKSNSNSVSAHFFFPPIWKHIWHFGMPALLQCCPGCSSSTPPALREGGLPPTASGVTLPAASLGAAAKQSSVNH